MIRHIYLYLIRLIVYIRIYARAKQHCYISIPNSYISLHVPQSKIFLRKDRPYRNFVAAVAEGKMRRHVRSKTQQRQMSGIWSTYHALFCEPLPRLTDAQNLYQALIFGHLFIKKKVRKKTKKHKSSPPQNLTTKTQPLFQWTKNSSNASLLPQ